MVEQYTKYWELYIKQKADTISPSEHEELEAWKNADKKHESIIREFEEIYKESAIKEYSNAFNPNDNWNEMQSMIKADVASKGTHAIRLFPWVARIAAAVILVLGITFIFYQYQNMSSNELNLQSMVQTDETNQKEIELPDGTKVWLNRNSELLFPEAFNEASRTVYLKGEAFFEVTPNTEQPFIVHSGISKTTVLGTSFNLRAYSKEDEVKLTVVTGKVTFALNDDLEGVIVTPGDMASLSNDSKRIVHGENTDLNFLSWKTGHLTFDNSPLEELIHAFERHYIISMDVEQDEILTCTYTGDFQDIEIESALKIITKAMETSYELIDGRYIIQGSGCK